MSLELAIAIAIGGGLFAALAGYLLGARRGSLARARLEQTVRHREEELRHAQVRLRAVLQAEKSELVRSTVSVDIEEMKMPKDEVAALAAEVREVMGPLAARARMQAALTEMPETHRHRGQLQGLLEEIAARAGLTTIVLSDEVGLPLAEAHAEAGEAVAAAASILLTLADRLATSGQPTAVGVVVHDTEGRRVLHRIFQAGSERYVLTAIAEGSVLGADSLDPAVPRVRKLLMQPGPVAGAVA